MFCCLVILVCELRCTFLLPRKHCARVQRARAIGDKENEVRELRAKMIDLERDAAVQQAAHDDTLGMLRAEIAEHAEQVRHRSDYILTLRGWMGLDTRLIIK